MATASARPWGRDARVIGLVGSAHFMSHFLQLTLPPLFPILRDGLGVGYVGLGLVSTVFYGTSGIGQTVSGFLVDRFGAARVLVGGLGLFGTAIALAGLSPSYGALIAIALVAGLGNSVFHPADYAIFNRVVDPRRLARAYSVHSIGGNLGWVAGPALVVTLSGLVGWRAALVAAGGLGILTALGLLSQADALTDYGLPAPRRAATRPPGLLADLRLLLATPILAAFAYFALLAMSLVGLQTFSVAAMVTLYHTPLRLATAALTGLLLGNSAGILAGGLLADRTRRHDLVAGAGMLLAAALTAVVGSAALPVGGLLVAMALAGFCLGLTGPSRDMLVRGATPSGASGKVFGFVYSGLDLGSLVMPLIYGWLLDRGQPRALFFVAAALMGLTVVTVVEVRRHSRPAVLVVGA